MFSKIRLFFVGPSSVELSEVEIFPSCGTFTIRSVRGKTEGAFRGAGTFQWTSAVRALSALLIKAALHAEDPAILPYIKGGRHSAACSLDYALSKAPCWLTDMFGVDASGDCLAKRIFKRTNPNLKRAGPVVISVNENLLRSSSIEVYLEGNRMTENIELRALLDNIEAALPCEQQISQPVFKQAQGFLDRWAQG